MITATTPATNSVVMSLRVSRDWRAFLAKLAERERCSQSDVIDKAICEFSRHRDGIEPPKR
jgi:predicted transcriptional regulator